jgi:hypothetical protein
MFNQEWDNSYHNCYQSITTSVNEPEKQENLWNFGHIFFIYNTSQQIMNQFLSFEKKINNSCLILVRWVRICFYIVPSTSGFWDNSQCIFQKHWNCPYWVASERDHKVFYENQSIRGFFGFESCFQNCFWNLFNASGLCQICKIKNGWKFPNPFSRNTQILSSDRLLGV